MESNFITVPLRVLLQVTGIPIFKWVDMFHQKMLNNDDTVYTFIDQACSELGLISPSRFSNNAFNLSFSIRDPHKLLTAKLKYNF